MQPEPVMPAARGRGFYSPAMKAGGFVFVSGQLPLDSNGKVSGTTVQEQTRVTMARIEKVLSAAGAGFSNLVQVTVYVTDISLWEDFNTEYAGILTAAGVDSPPSRAVVPVKDLHFGALLEIQAIAWTGGA